MQIRFSQIHDFLNDQSIAVLLVSGDEPYQHMLATDIFREHAKSSGFTERKILTVESGFDWSELEIAANNLSLFGERTLIDLRIPSGKPGVSGSKTIISFIQNLHQDVMILIQTPRLDRNTINSAWVKEVDKIGGVLRIWPLNEIETKKWIKQKLNSYNFSVADEVITFITQQVEGNLLAAMQEIDKLRLLCDDDKLDIKAVNLALTNSSHYSLNELTDALARKDSGRLIRILLRLKNEDFALPLLLWGLTEKIRGIEEIDKRLPIYNKQLENIISLHMQEVDVLDRDNKLSNDFLKHSAYIDRVIKGRASGNGWRELIQLSLAVQLST